MTRDFHSAPIKFILSALIGLALVGGCASSPSVSHSATEKLVVAIQPTLAADEMLEKARPIETYLEQSLGDVDVQIYAPLSQAGVIEALRFGQADIAFMGAWPAYLAVEKAGASLELAEVRHVLVDGKSVEATYYYSYWVVPTDSPLASLDETRGTRACFPSPISTSGYVAPVGKLIELGLLTRQENAEADPTHFFRDVRFGGGYQQCWQALLSGQVDVTVIAGDVPETLYNEVLDNTRVLEKQGPIPSHGILVRHDLAEPLRARAITAIEGLGAPEYRELMQSFISGIFVGFERTTADKHLGALKAYLKEAGLTYTEKIAP
jgi:phosphonate transport system substrate-binding protein